MQGAKRELIEVLKELPADAPLEDIRGEFDAFVSVLEGIRGSQAGQPAPDEVVLAELRAKLAERKADKPTMVPAPPSTEA